MSSQFNIRPGTDIVLSESITYADPVLGGTAEAVKVRIQYIIRTPKVKRGFGPQTYYETYIVSLGKSWNQFNHETVPARYKNAVRKFYNADGTKVTKKAKEAKQAKEAVTT